MGLTDNFSFHGGKLKEFIFSDKKIIVLLKINSFAMRALAHTCINV